MKYIYFFLYIFNKKRPIGASSDLISKKTIEEKKVEQNPLDTARKTHGSHRPSGPKMKRGGRRFQESTR